MNGNHCKKDAFFVQFYIVILTKNNLKKIQHCAELRAKGDLTLNERMEMLTVHRESLNVQIKVLQEHMAKLLLHQCCHIFTWLHIEILPYL